jgi:hypothetical protein
MLTDKSFAVGLPIVGRKDDLLTDPVLPALPLATVVRQICLTGRYFVGFDADDELWRRIPSAKLSQIIHLTNM